MAAAASSSSSAAPLAITGDRPVCKYGDKCFRRNPQHFVDFVHHGGDFGGPAALPVCPPCGAPPLPPPPPPTSSVRSSPSSGSAAPGRRTGPLSRKCKFGCGRDANRDKHRVYITCCRACGLCQGVGDHDDKCTGGKASSADSSKDQPGNEVDRDAKALMAVDLALELRRRAKDMEVAGHTRSAAQLMADSAEQLEIARKGAKPGSKLAALLDNVLAALRQAEEALNPDDDVDAYWTKSRTASNGMARSLGSFEEEVDAELDRLVTDLEQMLAELLAASGCKTSALARPCKMGCGRIAKAGRSGRNFDTCCRVCALCKGAGSHDKYCTGGPGATTSAIVLASTALATTSDSVEPFTGTAGDGREAGGSGSPGAKRSTDKLPAQEALACMGLSDEWPTDLTMREIRRRYMRECLGSHPDKGPPEEKEWRTARFQELSTAYTVLEAQMAVLERIRAGESAPERGPARAASSCPATPSSAPSSSGLLALEGVHLALPDDGTPSSSPPVGDPRSGASRRSAESVAATPAPLALEGPPTPARKEASSEPAIAIAVPSSVSACSSGRSEPAIATVTTRDAKAPPGCSCSVQ